ncbi:thioesterase family protein [Nocardiopsis sp. HNM0947]|uniref:Thioesterase family protein n=1 Tax=Nocardiopsis coralli TaxID=2772213 RepID=A0ABR9PCZ0_9ACTN|nr:acyl-CoA thioesterase domain-containing protein [Nocardiopsis coralli]MBE3001711.1 thioesterase family protein [Nocardiopsis coralli]
MTPNTSYSPRTPASDPSATAEPGGVSLEEVLALLELRPLEPSGAHLTRWRGQAQRTPADRLFGGLLLAQAIVAAGHTAADDQRVLSVQADFVRGVPTDRDLVWEVERVSDAVSMSTRRSTLRDGRGRELFTATTRWATVREDLPSYGALTPRRVAGPEDLPELSERFAGDERIPAWWSEPRPVHFRPASTPPYLAEHVEEAPEPGQTVWIRATSPLPDDHLVRAALVAYASDMSIIEDAFRVLGSARHEPGGRILSLTHSLTFHHQPDLSRWHQFDARVGSVSHGKALGTGEIFDDRGAHVVSASQIALVRTPAL